MRNICEWGDHWVKTNGCIGDMADKGFRLKRLVNVSPDRKAADQKEEEMPVLLVDGNRERNEVEKELRESGFEVIPKDYRNNNRTISDEQIAKEPEAFERFAYCFCNDLGKGEKIDKEFIPKLKLVDGKWLYNSGCSKLDRYVNDNSDVKKDVDYMEKYYPELYKKLMEMNGLSSPESDAGKDRNVNINYTYIAESSDLTIKQST